jgi:hypothetical protein
VLSQNLPCPPTESTLAASTPFSSVYTHVVSAIQMRLNPTKSPYVDITHAMPSNSSLESVPHSPPTTPGIPHRDDYFTTTIFSRATAVPSYHDSCGLLNPSAPASPFPAVPPASIHVSIVERYIPPCSTAEVVDLLTPTGPSVLLDRLFELSPNGGSLIFLFPTKTGSLTFKNSYLGPILDPLLRHIITVNDLSSDIGNSLGTMPSIDSMPDFETIKRKLSTICRKLNRQTHNSTSPSSNSGEYSITHASTSLIPLPRPLWSEWWVFQEQQRIRDILNLYWRTAKRLPIDKGITAMTLWRDILEGVKNRPYDMESQPAGVEGVEIGVFVIRKGGK